MQPREASQIDDRTRSLRRSTRVATDILIEVQGEHFAYAGETIIVNIHGALIRTSALLKIGMPLVVYVHSTGKSARARVVFAGDEANRRYGIELDHPDNIWGLPGAPPDWTSAI